MEIFGKTPLRLEDAVRKMTSSVTDQATFEEPHQLSVGVRDVWVNGARVLKEGEHTGATPGQVVRGVG